MCALLLVVCVVRACALGRGLTLPFWSDQANTNRGCKLPVKALSHCWRSASRLAEAAELAAAA